MKRSIVKILLLALLLLSLQSCSKDEVKVDEIASLFLENYLNLNYLDAISYCSDDLAGQLLELFSEFDEECDEVKQRVSDESKGSTFVFESIDTESEDGLAYVTYQLYPPDSEMFFVKHITLTRIDRIWKVTSVD